MGNEILELAEHQYKFGSGPIICRNLKVIAPVIFDDVLWWHVRGECGGGTRAHHGGWQERELYVIGTVLPGTTAPPGGDR